MDRKVREVSGLMGDENKADLIGKKGIGEPNLTRQGRAVTNLVGD